MHALFKLALPGKMCSDFYVFQNRDKDFHTTKTLPISAVISLERFCDMGVKS